MIYSDENKLKLCSYTYYHTHSDIQPDYLLLDASYAFIGETAPYLASALPLSDGNTFVRDFILSHEFDLPTIVGLSFTDPYKRMADFAARLLCRKNICGFCNFPTNGVVDGDFFQEIALSEIGFSREYEIMSQLIPDTDMSLAIVFTMEQAVKYAQAEIQALGLSPAVPPYWNLDDNLESDFSEMDLTRLKMDFPKVSLLELKYGQPFSAPVSDHFDGGVWL